MITTLAALYALALVTVLALCAASARADRRLEAEAARVDD